MGYENLITKKEEGLGWIMLNRPDKLNALNMATIKELYSAFLSVQEDPEVKAVIFTGTGDKAFIAGADIKELSGLGYAEARDYVLEGQELTKLIENFKKPVIAALNGFALGGGMEMALACHVRIASEKAKLGQPEVKLGLIPGFGGTQRLSRLAGKGIAMELILTGRVIDAGEALRIGLVNRVVPQEELLDSCVKLAREMTVNAPIAVQYGISAINQGLDKRLDEGLLFEAELFGMASATEDAREGTKAFLEKRKADFQGK